MVLSKHRAIVREEFAQLYGDLGESRRRVFAEALALVLHRAQRLHQREQ